MTIKSTGQGAIQISQPVHSEMITVWINFAAPKMASTGQAIMHLTQPIQSCSIINATLLGLCRPNCGLSGLGSTPNKWDNSIMPSSPPGGHWLISAAPEEIASA